VQEASNARAQLQQQMEDAQAQQAQAQQAATQLQQQLHDVEARLAAAIAVRVENRMCLCKCCWLVHMQV
jgi:hypothetical protein